MAFGVFTRAIKQLERNRAMLKKKAPFQIHKSNGFVKTTGKEFIVEKLTPAQTQMIRARVDQYKKADMKRLILVSALTVLVAIIVIVSAKELMDLII